MLCIRYWNTGLAKGLAKGYLHMLGLKAPVTWGHKMDGS